MELGGGMGRGQRQAFSLSSSSVNSLQKQGSTGSQILGWKLHEVNWANENSALCQGHHNGTGSSPTSPCKHVVTLMGL